MTVPTGVTVPIGLLDTLLTQPDLPRQLVAKLKAIADETRLTLLLLIAEKPRTVKELQEATGLSQTLVSHHLGPLREQELVSVLPQGRSNLYTLCCEALMEPVQLLVGLSVANADSSGCAAPTTPTPTADSA